MDTRTYRILALLLAAAAFMAAIFLWAQGLSFPAFTVMMGGGLCVVMAVFPPDSPTPRI